jgi:hypothetical protein
VADGHLIPTFRLIVKALLVEEAKKRAADAVATRKSEVKKRYIIAGLLASYMSVFGQRTEPSYSKKKLRETEIQTLLSYYTQDNDHSAVTGGKGTEDLQVYAAQMLVDWGNDSTQTYHIDAGVDVITSASTDNIDFVMSSASREDARSHLNLGFNRRIRNTGFIYGVTGGISIESDYYSRTGGLSLSHTSDDQNREWSLSFQAFFDDLRWGRFDNGEPQKLLYPSELRNKNWFTNYNRNSFNLNAGFSQAINSRMVLGIYPGVMYQHGLLSTPFHRVYFKDKSKRVENLPDKRIKFPLGIQLNTFLGTRTILRSYYRFYWDNYGVSAHALEFELPVKVGLNFILTPFVRTYAQSQANYFNPYGEHEVTQEFYTSDYDLSKFTSYKAGFGATYAPIVGKVRRFREVEIRYAFYQRSDGMVAHTLTTFVDLKSQKLLSKRKR